jgi:hypothetical protein
MRVGSTASEIFVVDEDLIASIHRVHRNPWVRIPLQHFDLKGQGRYLHTRRTGKVWVTALSLLSCLVVAGCGNQQPLSRDDAASRAATSYSSMHVYHTNAKLMTWAAWTRIGLYHPGEAAGVADLNIPPGRLVWVVALRDANGAPPVPWSSLTQ